MYNELSPSLLAGLTKGIDRGNDLDEACDTVDFRNWLRAQPESIRTTIYDNLAARSWDNHETTALADVLFPENSQSIPEQDPAWNSLHSEVFAKAAPYFVGKLPYKDLPNCLPLALRKTALALEEVPPEAWHLIDVEDVLKAPGSVLDQLGSIEDEPWKQTILVPKIIDRLIEDLRSANTSFAVSWLATCLEYANTTDTQKLAAIEATLSQEDFLHEFPKLFSLLTTLDAPERKRVLQSVPEASFTMSPSGLPMFSPEEQGILLSKGISTGSVVHIHSKEALTGLNEGLKNNAFDIPPNPILRFPIRSESELKCVLNARSLYRPDKNLDEGWPYKLPITSEFKQALYEAPETVEHLVSECGLSELTPDYLATGARFRSSILQGLIDRGQDPKSLNQYLAILDRARMTPEEDETIDFDLWVRVLGPYLIDSPCNEPIAFLQECPARQLDSLRSAYQALRLSDRAAQSSDQVMAAPSKSL